VSRVEDEAYMTQAGHFVGLGDAAADATPSVKGVAKQAAFVADQGALTGSAPAALTSAALTGGESPTEAEHNALQADVAALRTTLAAAVVDIAALRTKLNAALGSLRASANKPMATS
jgi:hypothetical protein